jgi:hypothetical protein
MSKDVSLKESLTPRTLETDHGIKIFQAVSKCDDNCPLWEECSGARMDVRCIKEQEFLKGKVQDLVFNLQETGIDPWQKDTAGMILPMLYAQYFKLMKHYVAEGKILYGDKTTSKVKADPVLKELRNVAMDITKASMMLFSKKKGSARDGGTVLDNIYD